MNIEKRLQDTTSLTPLEQQLGNYILQHKEEVIKTSIMALSDNVFVSKSAILRFCKKIGLKGFNELKVALAKESTIGIDHTTLINVNYPFEKADTAIDIAGNMMKLYDVTIHDTYTSLNFDTLKEITKLLYQAEVIDIYTHSHNLNVAENFQDKMLTIGKRIHCPKGFYEQRFHALSSDTTHVAVFLSYSGKASYILPLAEMLHKKQTSMIVIGKYGSNYYPQYIEHEVWISGKEDVRDRISQFSSHIAIQYVMDVIFGCLYNLDREKNIAYLHTSIDYMDDRSF